jgi:putative ATPase
MNMHSTPLAERLRPAKLSEIAGQEHLLGEGKVIQNSIRIGKIPSMILWGPPGVGKTTLAEVISKELDNTFYTLSAISAGVKEVREIIQQSEKLTLFKGKAPILFIDEIHRFNKAQQDALLSAVEKGIITLIGATTENPSFEVIPALLSRAQVYVLNSLGKEELIAILERAMKEDEWIVSQNPEIIEFEALLRFSGGDARKLLNAFEMVVQNAPKPIRISNELVDALIQKKAVRYDKSGEQHYDIISAFIKSLRGSDPNAAVYYLARMIEGGEDVKFIARRMLILASEDIGNANPTALVMATNTMQAVQMVGYPEGRIILSQCAIYLATSPKSNSAYMAIEDALALVQKTGDLDVPLTLRNAPTKLMKELDYGKDYQYAHAHEGNFVQMNFLPEEISGIRLYTPGNNERENTLRAHLRKLWGDRYGY